MALSVRRPCLKNFNQLSTRLVIKSLPDCVDPSLLDLSNRLPEGGYEWIKDVIPVNFSSSDQSDLSQLLISAPPYCEFSIGRAPNCNIRLRDVSISARHCRIILLRSDFLGSSHNSYRKGTRNNSYINTDEFNPVPINDSLSFYIIDKSTNGTFINKIKIRKDTPTFVSPTQVISLGRGRTDTTDNRHSEVFAFSVSVLYASGAIDHDDISCVQTSRYRSLSFEPPSLCRSEQVPQETQRITTSHEHNLYNINNHPILHNSLKTDSPTNIFKLASHKKAHPSSEIVPLERLSDCGKSTEEENEIETAALGSARLCLSHKSNLNLQISATSRLPNVAEQPSSTSTAVLSLPVGGSYFCLPSLQTTSLRHSGCQIPSPPKLGITLNSNNLFDSQLPQTGSTTMPPSSGASLRSSCQPTISMMSPGNRLGDLVKRLQQDNVRKDDEIAEMVTELEKAEFQSRQQDMNLHISNNALENCRKNLEGAENKMQSLQQQLDKANQTVSRMQDDLKETENWKRKFQHYETQTSILVKRLEQTLIQQKDLQCSRDNALSELGSTKAEYEDLQIRNTQIETELSQCKNIYNNISKKYEHLNRTTADLNERVSTLTKKLAASDIRNNYLEKEVSDASRQLLEWDAKCNQWDELQEAFEQRINDLQDKSFKYLTETENQARVIEAQNTVARHINELLRNALVLSAKVADPRALQDLLLTGRSGAELFEDSESETMTHKSPPTQLIKCIIESESSKKSYSTLPERQSVSI